jgi:beta-lactamase regulating signal transducer with metallopeptidase domain
MNTMLTLGRNVFEWTWKTSASAALLVALVFLAQQLLSRWLTARLRYTLSLLILVRLLFPIVPSSPLSLENLLPRRTAQKDSVSAPAAAEPAAPAAYAALPAGHSPGVFIGQGTKGTDGISPGLADVAAPVAAGLSVRARISLAWAAGFFCLMTLAVLRYRQWTRMVAQGQIVTDPYLLELLESARRDMGVRRPVKLVTVARLCSPAVFGIRRVRVLLPEDAAGQLSARELRMVFLHEMAHIRRHDVVLNFLLLGVQFLHWFNPLVWLANHWIRADRELVCDAMSLSRLPAAERPLYGQVLLKLMDGISAGTPVFPGVVPVVGGKQEIKRRLIMIKQQRHGSIGAGLATALAVGALACATFTRAQVVTGSPAAVDQKVDMTGRNGFVSASPATAAPGREVAAPDSMEGQLKAQGKKWEKAPGPVQPEMYVQDLNENRLDQPKGRGIIGKVTSLDEFVGMDHAWVDFGRGCVLHIRVSEICPIRFVTPERSARGSPPIYMGGGGGTGPGRGATLAPVAPDVAAADSVEGQLRAEGKSWVRAAAGSIPIQAGGYVIDNLGNRANQPKGRGIIGKVTSLDQFEGIDHAWVDFGRGWIAHIRMSELSPIRFVGPVMIGPGSARPMAQAAPVGRDVAAPDSLEGKLRSEGQRWQQIPGQVQVGGYVQDILAGRADQPQGRGVIAKVLSLGEYIGMPHAWVDFGRGCIEHIRTSELRPIRVLPSDIAAADSMEGQLKAEGLAWERISGQIRVGTYVEDLMLDRPNQPQGRGVIGKVVSVFVDAQGRTQASVDFGRNWVMGINVTELSPVRTFIPAKQPGDVLESSSESKTASDLLKTSLPQVVHFDSSPVEAQFAKKLTATDGPKN